MEERVRKVLHQDGASRNVTKLFSGRGDKLRLSPFYPINAAQFAPSEQNKDKHQIQVYKTYKQRCSFCLLLFLSSQILSEP